MSTKNEVITGAVIMAVMAMLVFLPGPASAGSLEPTAAPGSTMKSLDQMPPTWSQKISGAARFELVLDGTAVLDKETGLVWEKSPTPPDPLRGNFYQSMYDCLSKEVGGRMGWHLPTVEQLTSLVDKSQFAPGSLALPSGHPFILQAEDYWTSSTSPNDPDRAFVVAADGTPITIGQFKQTEKHNYWCVRGGQSHDAY